MLRHRLDLICTTAVVDSDIDMDLRVIPGNDIIEGAYCFLLSRISADKSRIRVNATVSTNYNDQSWNKQGFKKLSHPLRTDLY